MEWSGAAAEFLRLFSSRLQSLQSLASLCRRLCPLISLRVRVAITVSACLHFVFFWAPFDLSHFDSFELRPRPVQWWVRGVHHCGRMTRGRWLIRYALSSHLRENVVVDVHRF